MRLRTIGTITVALTGLCAGCSTSPGAPVAQQGSTQAATSPSAVESPSATPCPVTDPASGTAPVLPQTTKAPGGPLYDAGPFNVTFGTYQKLPATVKPAGGWSSDPAYGAKIIVTNTTANLECWADPGVEFLDNDGSELSGTSLGDEYASPDGAQDTSDEPIGPGQSVVMYAVYDGPIDPTTLTAATVNVVPYSVAWGAPGQSEADGNLVDLTGS